MTKQILGLDLGPNSVGWALIRDDDSEECGLIDAGVRVFPEGVANFDTGKEKSKNEDRRIARGMRRQIRRRVQRRKALIKAFIEIGLWPECTEKQNELYKTDPYELRAVATNKRLDPFEIGRIFLHLNQRRGFKSNRKTDRGDKEVTGMLAEINENEKQRVEEGFDTVGAWLAGKMPTKNDGKAHLDRSRDDRVRNRHLQRSQIIEEFEKIWKYQASFHPQILTDQNYSGSSQNKDYPTVPERKSKGESNFEQFGIYGIIFFQRKMYWPKSMIGFCEYEPKKRRCPTSDRRFQRFRLLQDINNLRYTDASTGAETPLSADERTLLLDKLSQKKEMSFRQIRKALNFLESIVFNLERGQRSKLIGSPIDAQIADKKILGKDWYSRSCDEKTEIVQALIDPDRDEDQLVERAINSWTMSAEEANSLLSLEFKPGYCSLSRVALDKILPHLEQGLQYIANDETDSAIHAAGYFRRDELKRRIFDRLPDPNRTKNCPIGDIANPVVKRCLTELRKVVNAIIREYGKPDAIHVEMAREVKQGREARKEYTKRIKDREKQRGILADRLRENGIKISRDNILKLSLWEEQKFECIYTGKPISFQKLFGEGGGVEVDHILPYSRTLDDSQANKVVCLRDSNSSKLNKTPYEWLSGSREKEHAEVLKRAGKLLRDGRMNYKKFKRFTQKELELDNFINRQLTDTAYISKVSAEYLRCLFGDNHKVLGLKGQLTAELRWQWGLSTVLEELVDSPGWQDKKADKLRDGEKNRADHRHHAVDAIVVALTNRKRLKLLSKLVKTGGAKKHGEILLDPWPNFRNTIKNHVQKINVSHRVDRKVSGALHEETLYGKVHQEEGVWAVRKRLADLSPTEIERIRDKTIRQNVMAMLDINDIPYGRGKAKFTPKAKELLGQMTMPSGVPIKKVRLLKSDNSIVHLRGSSFVKPGSTHHLCMFGWTEKNEQKYGAVFTSTLLAKQRLQRQYSRIREIENQSVASGLSGVEIAELKKCAVRDYPVISRIPPKDSASIPVDAEFIISLSKGEMIKAKFDGLEKLLVFKTATSTTSALVFYEHTDARKSASKREFNARPHTLDLLGKVTVDPLGRIRDAND